MTSPVGTNATACSALIPSWNSLSWLYIVLNPSLHTRRYTLWPKWKRHPIVSTELSHCPKYFMLTLFTCITNLPQNNKGMNSNNMYVSMSLSQTKTTHLFTHLNLVQSPYRYQSNSSSTPKTDADFCE